MVYQGGKFYQSKSIVPIINKCIKENSLENYYEPFCGGLNVIDKIQCVNLYANDIDKELIAFYQFIQSGGVPLDDVSKEEYYEIKKGNDLIKRGNVKYMASFGGKPWGGYSGIDKRYDKTHYLAAKNSFLKQAPVVKNTEFSAMDYKELNFISNSFIYCDPPYKGTTKYDNKVFNYDEFYEWVEKISQENFVIISEYSMPENFTSFLKIPVRGRLAANDNKSKISDNLYYCNGLFKNWYEGGI